MKILFVCLGNTCRSPMAESILKHEIKENQLNWFVDSAALREWNVGQQPEARCIKVLAEHNLSTEHICRMITHDDFYNFDYILCMDEPDLQELNELAVNEFLVDKKKMIAVAQLLGSYIGRADDEIIRDPYFCTDISAFRHLFEQISESCKNLIKQLCK